MMILLTHDDVESHMRLNAYNCETGIVAWREHTGKRFPRTDVYNHADTIAVAAAVAHGYEGWYAAALVAHGLLIAMPVDTGLSHVGLDYNYRCDTVMTADRRKWDILGEMDLDNCPAEIFRFPDRYHVSACRDGRLTEEDPQLRASQLITPVGCLEWSTWTMPAPKPGHDYTLEGNSIE